MRNINGHAAFPHCFDKFLREGNLNYYKKNLLKPITGH